jgi:hypothetical protein
VPTIPRHPRQAAAIGVIRAILVHAISEDAKRFGTEASQQFV